jgi:hypothetical protein
MWASLALTRILDCRRERKDRNPAIEKPGGNDGAKNEDTFGLTKEQCHRRLSIARQLKQHATAAV